MPKNLLIATTTIIILFIGLLILLPSEHNQPTPPGAAILPIETEGEITQIYFPSSDITITAEIADTPNKHKIGLMHRRTLPSNHGMLFIFPDEALRKFWMKNTFIPLDIIFLDNTRTVINIEQNAIPLNTDVRYSSNKPAKYVLEVNAGFTSKHDISPKDRVEFEL